MPLFLAFSGLLAKMKGSKARSEPASDTHEVGVEMEMLWHCGTPWSMRFLSVYIINYELQDKDWKLGFVSRQ